MFTKTDIDILLEIIPIGRQNAITAKDIAQKIGYSVHGNQVKTRRLIKYAIANGEIILSSSSTRPKGYWISNDIDEIKGYLISLKNRADKITKRANNLKSKWNNQNPSNRINV